MPTHYELAELSKQSYKDDGGIPPLEWKILRAEKPKKGRHGYFSVTYVNHKNKEIVVAFRGTDEGIDWLSNLSMAFWKEPPVFMYHAHQDFTEAKTIKENLSKEEQSFYKSLDKMLEDVSTQINTPIYTIGTLSYFMLNIYVLMAPYLSKNVAHAIFYNILKYVLPFAEPSLGDFTNSIAKDSVAEYVFKKNILEQCQQRSKDFYKKILAFGEEREKKEYHSENIDVDNLYFLHPTENNKNANIFLSHKDEILTDPIFIEVITENIFSSTREFLKESFPKTRRNYQNFRKTTDYSLMVIGHSLGGTTAELISCQMGVPVVSFDSPGCKKIIEGMEEYENYDKNKMVHYVAAPNLVNMLNGHLGTMYRLYIPHADKDKVVKIPFTDISIATPNHIFDCLTGTAKRVAAGTALVATAVVTMGGSVPITIGGGAALVGVTALAHSTSQFFSEWTWLTERQHKIANIVKCFDPKTGEAVTKSKVESWPLLNIGFFSSLSQFFWEYVPFSQHNKGLHNLLNEEEHMERRIESLPGYKVTIENSPDEKTNSGKKVAVGDGGLLREQMQPFSTRRLYHPFYYPQMVTW